MKNGFITRIANELWQSPGQFPTSQQKCELLESGQTQLTHLIRKDLYSGQVN